MGEQLDSGECLWAHTQFIWVFGQAHPVLGRGVCLREPRVWWMSKPGLPGFWQVCSVVGLGRGLFA